LKKHSYSTSGIAIPFFVGYTERAKEQVYNTNCLQFKKIYEGYLILENIDHNEAVFTQFMLHIFIPLTYSGAT